MCQIPWSVIIMLTRSSFVAWNFLQTIFGSSKRWMRSLADNGFLDLLKSSAPSLLRNGSTNHVASLGFLFKLQAKKRLERDHRKHLVFEALTNPEFTGILLVKSKSIWNFLFLFWMHLTIFAETPMHATLTLISIEMNLARKLMIDQICSLLFEIRPDQAELKKV